MELTSTIRVIMATSGTTAFNLDIADVIEEAMSILGGEQALGFEP